MGGGGETWQYCPQRRTVSAPHNPPTVDSDIDDSGDCNSMWRGVVPLVFTCCLMCGCSLLSIAGAARAPPPPAPNATCIVENCARESAECVINLRCAEALACDAKCQESKEVDACNLLCELTYGYNNTKYKAITQCMVDHGCMPREPPDGTCLATNNQTIRNLVNMSQVAGKWWILKGLNCGQTGWPAGFDFFPCQRDEFVFEGGQWIDHIAYTGGKNNTPTTPIVSE